MTIQKYIQHLSENSDSAFQTNGDQSEGTWILMIGVRSEASRRPKPLQEWGPKIETCFQDTKQKKGYPFICSRLLAFLSILSCIIINQRRPNGRALNHHPTGQQGSGNYAYVKHQQTLAKLRKAFKQCYITPRRIPSPKYHMPPNETMVWYWIYLF